MNKFVLNNGVRVVLEKIPQVRSVAIGIWIGVGSRHENKENNGISHFLEHMIFKGTQNRTARDIAEAFDSIGGQINAFTAKEYTCLYTKVLDKHAPFALEILADMFFNSTFDEVELEKEKLVVLEEIKMSEDTPDDLVHDLLSKAAFKSHPLGYPILGTSDTLESITSDLLFQYIEEMYTPDKIVISVAGNIDDSFIKIIDHYFGSFNRKGKMIQENDPIFHADKITRRKETEQAHICIGFEGLSLGSKQIYDLIIMSNILGGSMSSRLFQKVREEEGLAYSIYSYHSSYQNTGMLTIYSGTSANRLAHLYETIFSSIEEFKRHGITEKELNNSKEQLKGNLLLSLESTYSYMSRNGKNELLLQKHRSIDEIIEEINRVSLEDVHMMANDILTDHFSVSIVSPNL